MARMEEALLSLQQGRTADSLAPAETFDMMSVNLPLLASLLVDCGCCGVSAAYNSSLRARNV